MPWNATIRSRRKLSAEPTLRLITFQLRQNWFCLPLEMARKVIPYEQATTAGHGLIRLQNESVPVIDVARLIYRQAPQLPAGDLTTTAKVTSPPASHILVVTLHRQGNVGLLVEGQPALRRVPRSAFSPVPAVYVTMNHMHGVNVLVSEKEEDPPMFLLEVETLLPE